MSKATLLHPPCVLTWLDFSSSAAASSCATLLADEMNNCSDSFFTSSSSLSWWWSRWWWSPPPGERDPNSRDGRVHRPGHHLHQIVLQKFDHTCKNIRHYAITDVSFSPIEKGKPTMPLNEEHICSGLLWTCGWLGRHCLDYNFPSCVRRPFQPRCPFLHSYPDLDADHTMILVQLQLSSAVSLASALIHRISPVRAIAQVT